MANRTLRSLVFLLVMAWGLSARVFAEDGYDLWLRYKPLEDAARAELHKAAQQVAAPGERTPTLQAALDELVRGIDGLAGQAPTIAESAESGAILLVKPDTLPEHLKGKVSFDGLGGDGYRLLSVDGERTLIAANSDIGLLYGSFALLRHLQTGGRLEGLDVSEAPRLQRRMLNHWDNPDRTVERGYAGQSIWDWWKLPDHLDARYTDYARANASIGINGTVLNNVNAKAEMLTARWIAKAAALANVLRPYGIRVYLSARFSAPFELGATETADPLDPAVRNWWAKKADEIYAAIPDFGGFLVKANSEGQPGPQDYGRSHTDGANMLAAAVRPHGGIVLWRAFVYSETDASDRAKQAYAEFKPLDGRFADNVTVQVKNGPIDFQPREPIHPLFGAMPETSVTAEFQITKEYLGFVTHLAYLGPLYEEVLKTDTFRGGAGQTAAKLLMAEPLSGLAGVANIGSDRNWSGSHFDQANWYAFGRLAWDPEASAEDIAREWVAMTFSRDREVIAKVTGMMMASREAVVDYMTPMGLAHLMGTGHHYGPAPWVDDLARPEWNPAYYHRADAGGIGFDRTATGSDAIAQYAAPLAGLYGDRQTVPPEFLLWFHHVGWDETLPSGRTVWAELVHHYDRGVAAVGTMRRTWAGLEGRIDPARFRDVSDFLAIQEKEAIWWRDACLAYFASVSGRALPPGTRPPAHPLSWYQAQQFPYAPGHP
ncbi:alpha-glucuronidase family glycosyl hydrolase [Pseudokordiimonas caeni]|uniref:alpha-glucuronidase family glycosyl hydrolase n=1 Tax=Pseudokordiimonas caeni TaxID=2997908 RepID=UPI002811E81F|nr:alpha-glucuronidase family glycosyl hydrolase [Pseudokordiimonas caeni]